MALTVREVEFEFVRGPYDGEVRQGKVEGSEFPAVFQINDETIDVIYAYHLSRVEGQGPGEPARLVYVYLDG